MERGLQYLPIGLFASGMGLGGLSIAYQRYEHVFNVPLGIGMGLLYVSYLVFAIVALLYAVKWVRHPESVLAEFNHPVKANFFPAISISLLLLSTGTLEVNRTVSLVLWTVGTMLHFIFTVTIMSRWVNRSFEMGHVNPAWFIPVVGNIIVPIAGVEFAHRELAWFFFSVGIVFWLVLFTVVFYRLVFHTPLPPKLMPTLAILLAPPSVGFVSYTKIIEQIDGFARILLYTALFLVILLLSLSRNFWSLQYAISWWAYTFPLCAATIAFIVAYKLLGIAAIGWIATALLIVTTMVVGTVAWKTIQAVVNKTICVKEE